MSTELLSEWPQLWTVLDEGRASGLHLGGQIYIAQRGVVRADLAYGEAAPGVPLNRDHILPWLSSSKPLAAILLGQCYERGELSWDDPVSRFLPEFAANGKQHITLKHLLTHTGGIRGTGRYHPGQTWEEIIADICAMPLEANWVPGETAGYHIASSWFILGEVIQRLSGLGYSQAVQQFIAQPLGLTDTFVGMSVADYQSREPRMATMWLTEKGQCQPQPFTSPEWACWCSPGGGGRGPIHELGRIYEDLLASWHGRPARLLQPATLRLMTQRHRQGLFDLTFQHRMDWGLGLIINSAQYGAQTVPYGFGLRATPQTFGHSGFQSSCGMADPEHELVIALVMNGTPGEARNNKRFRQLLTAIYEDLGLTASGS